MRALANLWHRGCVVHGMAKVGFEIAIILLLAERELNVNFITDNEELDGDERDAPSLPLPLQPDPVQNHSPCPLLPAPPYPAFALMRN